jgi:hypothetical protein
VDDMLITVSDASRLFKIHETKLREKIRVKEIQPVNIQVKTKEGNGKDWIEQKINIYDYYELKILVGAHRP